MPNQDIPLRKATKVATDRLDFDRNNPRFTDSTLDVSSEAAIIEALADTADLGEVIQSIGINGYFDIEPLIVLQNGERLTVLEGNRRLAALKLLRDQELAAITKQAVPQMTPEARASLESVSVYRVSSPEEARDYIGFKHINGPHRWDALSKARFAADWYTKGRTSGVTIKQVAKSLGDSNDTVLRLISGIYVLDQAKRQGVFDIADRFPGKSFAFSHLYTALTRPGYRDFLGLPSDWRTAEPDPNPVPADKLENLQTVMRWLYGSKSDKIQPVIRSQNPNIKQLGAVLATPTAKAMMLARNDLREAYQQVEAPSERFETALINSVQSSEAALSQIASADAEDETILALGSRLFKTASVINRTLRAAATADEE